MFCDWITFIITVSMLKLKLLDEMYLPHCRKFSSFCLKWKKLYVLNPIFNVS